MIQVVVEFVAKTTVRSVAYVYDDDDNLVEPTSVLVTLIDKDGLRSSTATATTANHLIDTIKNQFAAGDVGKTVYNSTDETTAKITTYNSPSDVTLDTNIMADGESYGIYGAYGEDIVVAGKIVNGIYEHYYKTGLLSAKGWWTGEIEVVDGEDDDAKTSLGQYSFKVK